MNNGAKGIIRLLKGIFIIAFTFYMTRNILETIIETTHDAIMLKIPKFLRVLSVVYNNTI